MDKLQAELEFSKIYKKDSQQATILMYGKLLDVEQEVMLIKKLLSVLFGMVVVPIVGIIIAAFFRVILKV